MSNIEMEASMRKHIEEDYPEVLRRLSSIECILHEISGGMKVLRFIGWIISGLAATWIFFKDHLFHLVGK